jgi:uncharacterized protein YfiM (DUF2279 family)
MLKIFLCLFLISGVVYCNDPFVLQQAEQDSLLDKHNSIKDSWFSRDKGLHLAGTFMTTGFVILSSKRFIRVKAPKDKVMAVSVSFSLSLGKEIYDSGQSNNHFSYKDLTADVAGILIALLVFR